MGPCPLDRKVWLTHRNTLLPQLITVNFIALSQTIWAQVGGAKIRGSLVPTPWGNGVADILETCSYTTPNFVAVDQTVWS